jgi:hypothetical protein
VDDFNPYAAPEIGVTQSPFATEADEGRGVWQDGKILVMAKVARLPSRCVKCNEPATFRLRRKLAWMSPWFYVLLIFLLGGLLLYALLGLVFQKTAVLEIPLCEKHRAKRSRGILIGWIVGLMGFALCFSPAFSSNGVVGLLVLLGIFMILFGLIFGSITSQVVTPQKIDDTHVWLKKVSPLYLAELPILPGSGGWERTQKSKLQLDEL